MGVRLPGGDGLPVCVQHADRQLLLRGNQYRVLKSNRAWIWVYRASVLAMVIFGSVTSVKLVWDLADLFMGLMVIVNLVAISYPVRPLPRFKIT